jgi:hypothetical protein
VIVLSAEVGITEITYIPASLPNIRPENTGLPFPRHCNAKSLLADMSRSSLCRSVDRWQLLQIIDNHLLSPLYCIKITIPYVHYGVVRAFAPAKPRQPLLVRQPLLHL